MAFGPGYFGVGHMNRITSLLLAGTLLLSVPVAHAQEPALLSPPQARAAAVGTRAEANAGLQVSFDRPSREYGIGEVVGMTLTAERDLYVTIVAVGPDGNVVRLFPNKHQPDGLVRVGAPVSVPDPASGAKLTVAGPVGRELIKVFWSEKPLAIFADLDLKGQGTFRAVDGGVDTLARSLGEARAAGARIRTDNIVLTTVETPVVAAVDPVAPELPTAKPQVPAPSVAEKPARPKPQAAPVRPVKKPKAPAVAAVPKPAVQAPATQLTYVPKKDWALGSDEGPPVLRPRPTAPAAGQPVPMPQAQTGQLQIPQMPEMPQLEMPQIQMPQIQMPQIQIPGVEMPQVQMPQVQMPQIQMPQIQMPQVQLPGGFQLQMPQIQLPFGRSGDPAAVEAGSIELADASDIDARCKDLVTALNAAVGARDVATAAAKSDAIATDAACGAFQIPAQRRLAALRLSTAQELMAADGAEPGDYLAILEAAERPQVLWQASATLGQVYFSARRFAEAAAAYERAIEIIKNETRTPKAPPEADIQSVIDRAAQARILAANPTSDKPTGELVKAGRDHRSGMVGGVYSQTVRGITPKTVPVPITFEFDKASFTPIGQEAAAELLDVIREQQPERIVLVGHTDRKGGDAYNRALSAKRAAAVAEYLRANGIEVDIETEGKGFSEPIRFADDTGLTEEDLDALNRRVEWRRQ
ncbi:DUF4384 domain-containing protein [Chthonobacter albigriseus]|uniref:DUF4384 domain-containing protein n=1 Tax=Chthonobacter albigriseus TaxID=1683161 RepID=UPI0015EF1C0E|nr:DUF4384 domain-containing protein [Chthonobacter albigriseus]